MALLDDLKTVQTRKPSLPEWLLSREPDERAEFETAIDNPVVPLDSLMQIVRRHGGATTVKSLSMMRESRKAARDAKR